MLPGASFASVTKPAAAAGFSNAKSVSLTGSATSTAGQISFGQPSAWNVTQNANEITFAYWFKRNGRDGRMLTRRTSGNANYEDNLSSGAIFAYAGGNFMSGGSGLSDGAWHFVVHTVRNESGTYVGRLFVDGNTTSIANVNAGTDVNTGIEWLWGHKHSTNNTDYDFGAYINAYVDELTVWSVGMTGTQAAELYNSGTPGDPTTHSQAASLINWYRMGDGDTSPTIIDVVGSDDATLVNTGTATISTTVPP